MERLAFRCAEDDTNHGTSLDPHSMTPDDVEGIVPSKESAKRLIKFLGRQPGKMIRDAFYGAYKQRIVELLKDGQASAGMCVEDDCRRPVKQLAGHTFRRCPPHMDAELREQST